MLFPDAVVADTVEIGLVSRMSAVVVVGCLADGLVVWTAASRTSARSELVVFLLTSGEDGSLSGSVAVDPAVAAEMPFVAARWAWSEADQSGVEDNEAGATVGCESARIADVGIDTAFIVLVVIDMKGPPAEKQAKAGPLSGGGCTGIGPEI